MANPANRAWVGGPEAVGARARHGGRTVSGMTIPRVACAVDPNSGHSKVQSGGSACGPVPSATWPVRMRVPLRPAMHMESPIMQ